MNSKERLSLAQWAIKFAKEKGADDAKVNISNGRDISINFRDRKLENLKESTSNSLSLNIYANNRYSGHSTSNMRKDALEKFIEEAVSATKYLSEDEFRKLPNPKYYPEDLSVDLELNDSGYENVSSDQRKQIAQDIESVTLDQSDKIISAECGYQDSYSERIQVHSNGFEGELATTQFWAGASVTVKDDNGGRPSDWYWGGSRFFDGVPKAEIVGKEAVSRALRKIGQSKIDSGKYDIIVENRAGSRLVGMLSNPLSARALQQKSSYLEGMLGKQIASEKLTMIDDPFIKKAFGSKLYDGDGIAARKKVVVERGVLNHYYIDTYYGKKLGMEPNCSSPSNILFELGDKNLTQILKGIKKGIFITSFIGGNSNSTTGDFSFGLVGQLVENGEIVQPVNELNLTGNAKEFWNNLVAVGNDPYEYSSWRIPTLQFADADISGK